ncbi:hypothetical protein LPJ54_003066 [Coemansia sp. RSA 1824]|nr:hypothetical protein LPJ54_003066 [Coemansia sp. RSA 1824]
MTEQWLFSSDDLVNTPSQCGEYSPLDKALTPGEELELRLRGCGYIHSVVQRLNILKEISRACALVASKGNTSEADKAHETWSRLLKRQEIVLLENCCFDLDVRHPYAFIDALAAESKVPVFLAKAATAHVNDCLRSTVCLRFGPSVIAVAALYLAIGVHEYEFRGSLFESRAVDLPKNAVEETELCVMEMLEFYRREADSEKHRPLT